MLVEMTTESFKQFTRNVLMKQFKLWISSWILEMTISLFVKNNNNDIVLRFLTTFKEYFEWSKHSNIF